MLHTNLETYPLRPNHHSSIDCPLPERTIGVIHHNPTLSSPGYNLFSKGKETYLLDSDGKVVHNWRSHRVVFCAYLLPNGNLLRDGSESPESLEGFDAGGAAGYVEVVDWDNQLIWSWSARPARRVLTHHDLEPLPNGGCLLLCWERRTKEEALAVGRCPELIPDGEVWDNHIIELKPDGNGGAQEVWTWKLWDHLCQDYDSNLPNYVSCPSEANARFDINRCPIGGKQGCRDRTMIGKGVASSHAPVGQTGEKDWVHINSVSYCERRDAVLLSFNVHSELILVDRQCGDIVWRWGNPVNYGGGTRLDQRLFCPHAAHFHEGGGGSGSGNDEDCDRVLLFNNGRKPDRHWSSVDELEIPATATNGTASGHVETNAELVWTYGPPVGRERSFYCTHISGVERLENGNTLVLMGPQGIIFEVTSGGDEVWRYVCPVMDAAEGTAECIVRQGDQRMKGRFSLFCFRRYPKTYEGFEGRELGAGRHLEG